MNYFLSLFCGFFIRRIHPRILHARDGDDDDVYGRIHPHSRPCIHLHIRRRIRPRIHLVSEITFQTIRFIYSTSI